MTLNVRLCLHIVSSVDKTRWKWDIVCEPCLCNMMYIGLVFNIHEKKSFQATVCSLLIFSFIRKKQPWLGGGCTCFLESVQFLLPFFPLGLLYPVCFGLLTIEIELRMIRTLALCESSMVSLFCRAKKKRWSFSMLIFVWLFFWCDCSFGNQALFP